MTLVISPDRNIIFESFFLKSCWIQNKIKSIKNKRFENFSKLKIRALKEACSEFIS